MFSPQPKTKAYRSKKYLEWIREQPVLISGQGETISHHVRIDGNAGMGIKAGDNYAVPLPKLVHDLFHAGQESDREFFERHGVDIYRELFLLISKYVKEKG